MTIHIERRQLDGHFTTSGRKLVGHAAKFSTPARIGSDFSEIIAPGAFKRSLREAADILALIDHDASRLLGRTRSNTLRLREDEVGLEFEIDLPETQNGRDILALAERNDLGGMSFGFRVPSGGETWNAQRTERTLTNVDLVEVSVISSFPAYTSTTVSARSASQQGSDLARRIRILELGAN